MQCQLEQHRHWLKEVEMGIISKEDYQKLVYGSKDASPPPPDPVVRNR